MNAKRVGRAGQRYVIPGAVASVLERLPALPPAWLFAQLVNEAVMAGLDDGVIAALAGRRIRIRVSDARVYADFSVRDGRFVVAGGADAPDVVITASAWDFLLLARRVEDPDALFFARRLLIEGDTALGLHIKNALDALELPPLGLRFFRPASIFAHVRAQIFDRLPRRASSLRV